MSWQYRLLNFQIPSVILFYTFAGLDLVEVGKDEVTLRLGKQANRRQLQFALQSLVAVFGKYQVKYKLTGFCYVYM